jgi:peptidoglycan/xylan/chitin deacetylase (PgdA/CDA1 family)
MVIKNTYYYFKPLIPRRLQISLRRMMAQRKLLLCKNIWPIDEKAGNPPIGWTGWPDKKKFALVLTHDVETSKGQGKCYSLIKLEERLGFKSSFNFVPEEYSVSSTLRDHLTNHGFEVGVHGLRHHGNIFQSKANFQRKALKINHYLREWESVGFRAPCMYHNLDWIHDLEVEYDTSTFDTDPFEPQPDGIGTIFPLWVQKSEAKKGYVELPYTLPQDFTLFVIMKERNIDIWKQKLDWIVEQGGMALLLTHPDYMNFGGERLSEGGYPAGYYEEFLNYTKSNYEGQYWPVLPKDMGRFWSKNIAKIRKE